MVKLDDVGVRKLLQVHDLPIGSLAISHIPERVKDALQCAHLFVPFVSALPHLPVRSLPHLLYYLVLFYYFYVHVVIHSPDPALP